jgi:SAM-dependent methyltransferase
MTETGQNGHTGGLPLWQDVAFGADHDYRAGSPHLRHWALYDRLTAVTQAAIRATSRRGLPLTVLEVGAGHGGYTQPCLAAGCAVTVTEMSRASLERMQTQFGLNPHFAAVFDANGSLDPLGDTRFSLILCASVLHHIPDYRAFIHRAVRDHLLAGGTLLTLQDPLWYPRVGQVARRLDRVAYLSWRLGRGRYWEGFRSFSRRLRNAYDEAIPNDMVEYHVLRSGVDEEAIVDDLKGVFESVDVTRYWSTQSPFWQKVGVAARLENTFLLEAAGFMVDERNNRRRRTGDLRLGDARHEDRIERHRR